MAKGILVILAHPDMEKSRLNQKLAEAAREAGASVHELYKEYPDGKVDAKREQALLLEAGAIVLQFPFYWYSSPSLLKEWQDKVLEYGFAYGSSGKALHGKKLLVATTTGGPAEAYRKGGYNNFSLEELLRPFEQTASLCGMEWQPPFAVNGARTISDGELAGKASEYRQRLKSL